MDIEQEICKQILNQIQDENLDQCLLIACEHYLNDYDEHQSDRDFINEDNEIIDNETDENFDIDEDNETKSTTASYKTYESCHTVCQECEQNVNCCLCIKLSNDKKDKKQEQEQYNVHPNYQLFQAQKQWDDDVCYGCS